MENSQSFEAILRPSPVSKIPETIAHYTGLEGLRCILASNQIWASNVLFLNDSQEMTYGINEAVKFLTEQSQVAQDPGYRKVFTNIKKAISGEIPDAFACCLCENADMLGQWRGYGGIGQNVSVGFDTRQLELLLTMQNARRLGTVESGPGMRSSYRGMMMVCR